MAKKAKKSKKALNLNEVDGFEENQVGENIVEEETVAVEKELETTTEDEAVSLGEDDNLPQETEEVETQVEEVVEDVVEETTTEEPQETEEVVLKETNISEEKDDKIKALYIGLDELIENNRIIRVSCSKGLTLQTARRLIDNFAVKGPSRTNQLARLTSSDPRGNSALFMDTVVDVKLIYNNNPVLQTAYSILKETSEEIKTFINSVVEEELSETYVDRVNTIKLLVSGFHEAAQYPSWYSKSSKIENWENIDLLEAVIQDSNITPSGDFLTLENPTAHFEEAFNNLTIRLRQMSGEEVSKAKVSVGELLEEVNSTKVKVVLIRQLLSKLKTLLV